MTKIKNEILALKHSPLYKERVENKYNPVIGEGDIHTEIIFIGEAPGKNEALSGKPFCGASGKILDELLEHIELRREQVYITNIVKDRPTNNRDPEPGEIELYAPFLIRQIEIIQPRIIATLGRFSMNYIMQYFGLGNYLDVISKIHGQNFSINTSWGEVMIIPLYHPAVAVYNRKKLDELKSDFKKMSALLNNLSDKK